MYVRCCPRKACRKIRCKSTTNNAQEGGVIGKKCANFGILPFFYPLLDRFLLFLSKDTILIQKKRPNAFYSVSSFYRLSNN